MLNKIVVTALCLSFFSIGAFSQFQSLPKGMSIYQLDNGMKVMMIENPSLPMIGVNVIVKVGSANENFATSGMSHMLEHLLFNGTTTRSQKQLYDDVDRIGGYNNASTTEFYTNFMMVTPTENIRKGMEIQADMLFNSTLPAEKFQKEKGIVLEEISKSVADPVEQLERNTIAVLYPGHALSLPTLGTYSTIQGMSREGVHAFYKNNYVPNNMMLTVIGNFQSAEMLTMIKEIYGKAISGQVEREENPEWGIGWQTAKTIGSTSSMHYRSYDGTDRVLQVFFPLPKNESAHFFHLMSLAVEKAKDGIQATLKATSPQQFKSLKFSNRVSHLGNYLDATILLGADPDYTLLIDSLEQKVSQIGCALSKEVVQSEITRARTEFARNLEKPHMFGIYNSEEIVRNGFESVIASSWGIGYSDAASRLGQYRFGPPATILLQTPSLKKAETRGGSQEKATFFRNDSTGKNLIVVKNDLSNLLAIHYLIKHKAVYEASYGKDAARILHDCFDQRLKTELNQKMSSRFGFSITVNDNPFIPMDDIYLHPDFGYIRVEGLADDIPGAVDFLNSQMKDFVPTEVEFKKSVEKFRGIAMMQMGGDKAKKIFDDTVKSILYEPDPYTKNKMTLTYENLTLFAKEYFKPANMIISVVSPSNPEIIDSLFSQFVQDSVAKELEVFTPLYHLQAKPFTAEKTMNGERSFVFWGFVTQVEPQDAPVLQALSLVLSNGITFDIREKQGMAYSMSAGVEVIKDRALFFISQGTRPENVGKLTPQYPKFFQMQAVDTLKEADLEKSITMYLGRMMFRRLSSINQAFYLGNSLYFHNDAGHDQQFLHDLKKVRLADLKMAAKKYMKIANPVLIVVK